MKIAILGYGKMGRIIEKVAEDRNHEIILKIGSSNQDELTTEALEKADVVIEFSTPDVVLHHIQECFKAKVPIVVGTTGWYEHLQAIENQCKETNNTLLYASNFSIGVNVFFHANRLLAKLMNNYPNYKVHTEEIHHTRKMDSPSGTAITIAEGIIEGLNNKQEWVNTLNVEYIDNLDKTIQNNQLLIASKRIEDVPGTHFIQYTSEVDCIELKHTALNRDGFAFGTVLAAEWVQGKKGFYSEKDMFDFDMA